MNMLIAIPAVIAVAAVAGAFVRPRVLRRQGRPPECEPFEGTSYQVGKAVVVDRAVAEPRVTVIAIHGFCENARYFTAYYGEPDVQLILLTSCNYHLALTPTEHRPAPWAQEPAAPEGSIEYDAAVLVQALEHLPRSRHIRVHGHSRGGAVVLEAAAMRPDLFRGVEVVLEAPVLPAARLRHAISTLFLWAFPLMVPLWQAQPIPPLGRVRWGRLDDARKRELIASLAFNAKDSETLLANLRSIDDWMRRRQADIYRHIERGVVLVPDDDQVLDTESMIESARSAGDRLRVVKVSDVSHFILLDRPEALPPLPGMRSGHA